MRMIWYDPGGHTGWASYDSGTFVTGCYGPEEHHYNIYSQLTTEYWDIVGYETFTYQKRPEAPELDLTAVEIIGVIKLVANASPTKLVRAARLGKTKSFWTDDKLRQIGFYPGNKHERDAMRMLLHYLTFELNDRTWMFMLK